MTKYRLICMSFDGEYKRESPIFDTVNKAWEYENDLGSKWYFYPFHFVTTESCKTVVDTPDMLNHFVGCRVKTMARLFKEVSQRADLQEAGVEEFALEMSIV